jgi:hypothetical protein
LFATATLGVQIGIPGPAVPVCERRRDQTSHINLTDPLRARPGEQRVPLDKRQRILHGVPVGTFNHGRHTLVSDRPQRRHRLDWREGQVIAGDCLRSRPGVFGDLPGQLPGIRRLAAMLGDKELPGDLGAHLCPVGGRHRPVPRQTGRLINPGDPFRDFTPECADVMVDLERDAESGHGQIVAFSQIRPFELLHPQLCQRVQAAAEQRPHLLRGHRIAGGKSVDSLHPGTDPQPRCLTPFGVVGRQAGVPLLGRIQSSHLPREVVIAQPGGELVDARSHAFPKGIRALGGHLDRGTFRWCIGCIGLAIFDRFAG